MPRWVTNQGTTYSKQAGTGVLTSVVWGLICIVYDYFNMNDWLFPFVKGFSLKAILTTAAIGTILLIALAVWVFAPNDQIIPEQRLN